MTTVALLGTGTMGAGMARNLLDHGHDLRVWNRTRARAEPLGEAGATVADDPSGAVRGADVVITVLFDADSVIEVLRQAGPELSDHAVVVQASTVGLDIDRVAEEASRLGVRLLDAPVLGTKQPAEAGELVVLAAGDRATADVVSPVLDAIGSRTLWVGDAPGPASRLKLVCNAWVALVNLGVAQSVALASGLGLDPQLFLDAVSGSAVDAPYVGIKGGAMLRGDDDVSFQLDGVRKDLGLITAAAVGGGVASDLLDAVSALYDRASEQGHGEADMAAVRSAF